jgi:hypothetical protein
MSTKKTNKEKDTNKTGFWRETFSGPYGHLSSKRILGGIVLMVCLFFIVFQALQEGITDNIKELFEWLIITSTALLGITSVGGIMKSKYNKKDE